MKLSEENLSYYFRNVPIFFYDKTDSTNTRAAELLKQHNYDRFVVVANEQTAGKGRCGKSFYSPKDSGCYFSVVIHSDCDISDIVGLTPMAAVAVVRGIKKTVELDTKIKWVNDIYINDKKICGILVQKSGNAYIIGIGINITTEDFPEDLKNKAGSIGIDIDKNELIFEIASNIFSMSDELEKRAFMAEYRRHSLVIGQEILYYVNGTQFDGTAIGIDDNGGLIVNKNGIKKVLTSGEITVRTKNFLHI